MVVFTEEHKRRISASLKGKPKSEEHKKHLSEVHIGCIPWNKGKKLLPLTEEHKMNVSKALMGRRYPKGYNRGSNNSQWRGGITPLGEQIRHCFEYRLWRSDVYTRDDFTCQECNRRGGYLHAHHNIKSFSDILVLNDITTLEQARGCSELWDINNGITYCKLCHESLRR